ncbi:MAG: hypothetical protein LDL22_10445 [Hyphomicrobiales bacterium]|nr:hypothetical protein [Hyphomicrobiales bacterium]
MRQHAIRRRAALALLILAGCTPEPSGKTIEEMSPAEVEAAIRVLEAACRRAGIAMTSRAWDDCIRDEAIRRGYAR